jgi:hypothetical protein
VIDRTAMVEKLNAAKGLMSEALVISMKLPHDEITDYLADHLEQTFMHIEWWIAKEYQFRNKVGEYASVIQEAT